MLCAKHDLDYFKDEGCPLCALEAMSDEDFMLTFIATINMAEIAIDEAEQLLKVQL